MEVRTHLGVVLQDFDVGLLNHLTKFLKEHKVLLNTFGWGTLRHLAGGPTSCSQQDPTWLLLHPGWRRGQVSEAKLTSQA